MPLRSAQWEDHPERPATSGVQTTVIESPPFTTMIPVVDPYHIQIEHNDHPDRWVVIDTEGVYLCNIGGRIALYHWGERLPTRLDPSLR